MPKESKVLISFLNKLGTETKLQSFNLKDISDGSWDFTYRRINFPVHVDCNVSVKGSHKLAILTLPDLGGGGGGGRADPPKVFFDNF